MSDQLSVQLRDTPAGCGKNLNAGLHSELSHGNKRVQAFYDDDFEFHNNLEVYTYKIRFSDCVMISFLQGCQKLSHRQLLLLCDFIIWGVGIKANLMWMVFTRRK